MGLGMVSSEPVEHTDVLWPALRSGSQSEGTGDSSSPLSPWGQQCRSEVSSHLPPIHNKKVKEVSHYLCLKLVSLPWKILLGICH